jgi:hypothetical protein
VPDRHSIKRKKAERTAYRRAAELVDALTLRAHLLTLDALAQGQHATRRYIALCGQEVIPASLVEPGRSRCQLCVSSASIPMQRLKTS